MSAPTDVALRLLVSQDASRVRRWLELWLLDHVASWAPAHGLHWTPSQVRSHVVSRGLVARHWRELDAGRTDPEQLVVVAIRGGAAVGLVWVERRRDRYLDLPLGVISWLFVDPEARGQGVAGLLLAEAVEWMRAQGLPAAEVYVTSRNGPAVRAYEAAGFRRLDDRLVRGL